MTKAWYGIMIVLGACAHHSAAVTPSPTGGAVVRMPIAYADSATVNRLRREHPPDSLMLAFSRREDSLAALVDTIVVLHPDSILLHVGQAVEMLTLIETQGRRASGEVLPTFPSFLDVEDMTIAQGREAGLTGLRVGRTHVKITVMSRTAHAPPSYVPVRVVP